MINNAYCFYFVIVTSHCYSLNLKTKLYLNDFGNVQVIAKSEHELTNILHCLYYI